MHGVGGRGGRLARRLHFHHDDLNRLGTLVHVALELAGRGLGEPVGLEGEGEREGSQGGGKEVSRMDRQRSTEH